MIIKAGLAALPPALPACERKQTALSLRERQIVLLIQQAKSNKEIAHELSLTVGTVKEYLYRIFRKVHVVNRTELALRSRDFPLQVGL